MQEQQSKLKLASKYCDIYFIRKGETDEKNATKKSVNENTKTTDPESRVALMSNLFINTKEFKLSPEDSAVFNKGLKIYNEMTGRLFPNKIRYEAFVGLYKYAEDEFTDKITRIRDGLSFLDGENLEKEVELLLFIMKDPSINSHQRFFCPLAIFNAGLVLESQDGFSYLAKDKTLNYTQRVESCRYLVFSEEDRYYNTAKKVLADITNTMSISSSKRYEIISSFNSKTGLSTIYNSNVLNVEFKEDLIYDLQKSFFNNKENDERDRILSGSVLLELSLTTEEERNNVVDELLNMASQFKKLSPEERKSMNKDDLEEIRNKCGDAADVVLRLGNSSQKNMAREVLEYLGQTDENALSSIYSDAQNVHNESITEAINTFIEKILLTAEGTIEKYDDVRQEIDEMIYKADLNPKDKNAVFKALHRISVDTAKFTQHNITSSELLIHVWMKVKSHSNSDELKKRLIEELKDTSSTCSTGYSGRLVNVLSGYYGNLTLSWKDQVIANMSARIQKRIQSIGDEDYSTSIIMGMTETSDSEDRRNYMKFLTENLLTVYKELYQEFIDYIKEDEFNSHFKMGLIKWGLDPANKDFSLPF